jgi:hypothetical protein
MCGAPNNIYLVYTKRTPALSKTEDPQVNLGVLKLSKQVLSGQGTHPCGDPQCRGGSLEEPGGISWVRWPWSSVPAPGEETGLFDGGADTEGLE